MSQPLYFGNELDAFIPSDNAVVEAVTQFNATYCRCSIQIPQGSYARSIEFAPQTAMWFHMDNFMDAFNPGYVTIWHVNDDMGVTQFQIRASKFTGGLFNTTYTLFYLSAPATFTQIGGGAVANSSLQTLDLFVDIPNGVAQLNIAGSDVINGDLGAGGMGAMSNFAQVFHEGGRDGHVCNWSQLFGSTTTTIGRRLKTIVEDTNGAVQDFTGAVTDINELVLSDGTGITAAAADLTSTYYKAGLALSGNILGMGTSARFNVSGGAPPNLQSVLRVSAANYNGPSFAGAAPFEIAQNMWMTNPATAAPWTPISAAAVQWGAESRA